MERIAKFYKVSLERFLEDCTDLYCAENVGVAQLPEIYEAIKLPTRGTAGSAGYDICTPFDLYLEPNETLKFPTGLRCQINEGWVLQVVPRSSVGFKYGLTLSNTVGIIDSDYFNADNEGHIWCKIRNNHYEPVYFEAGSRICQGLFIPFGITLDDEVNTERTGGIGSTGK